MSSSTMLRYQATKQGGPLEVVTVPKSTPDANEVCIRIKAIGLNPLDWKSIAFGIMVPSWPAVFGVDGAGVVESVGEGVTAFKAGDEVFSVCGMGGKAASFQEFATVPQTYVSKKPSSLSFEEAASLPICYLTAAAAIIAGLHIPVPFISAQAPGESTTLPKSVLILGGGSSVGSNAVQMLRAALPKAVILTTASLKHDARLKKQGATATIDRSSKTVADDVKAIVPGGVDAILDAVGAAGPDSSLFDALSADGPRLYSQVVTGPNIDVPEGINGTNVFGRMVFGVPGGAGAMAALGKQFEEGKYQLPVPVEVVGKGFDAVGEGMKLLQKGLSGQKLVATL